MSESNQDSLNINKNSQEPVFDRYQIHLPQHRDSVKNAALFNYKMTESQIQRNVIKLYDEQFMQAIYDSEILSDRVSVQDLKIIMRGLNIASGHALNAKKQILIEQLQSYLQSDFMKELYDKYLLEREENKKKREEKMKKKKEEKKDDNNKENKDEEEEDEISDEESEQRENKLKKNNGNGNINNNIHKRTFPTRKKPQSNGNNLKNIVIPRLKYDEDFNVERAVKFLQSANEFINHVSDRLDDIERAMSIMSFRLSELEKIYMQSN